MFELLKRNPAPTTITTPSTATDDTPRETNPEALLNELEWTTIRRLDGQIQGDFRTLFRGAGLMLADLREYQAFDDVRHIDWNVTARMRTPFVREHLEEREISAWFLVDLTGSINFGSGLINKHMLALNYVATLARLLTRHGNRVGAILYEGTASQRHTIIPPRSGRAHILHLIHRMLTLNPSQQRSETNLKDFFQFAQSVIQRRSMVFIVSDFISVPGWEAALKPLRQRHDVVAARLMDPSESCLPTEGLILVEDMETGEQLFVDSDDAGFRTRYDECVQAVDKTLQEAFEQSGVDCLELDTSETIDRSLMRYLRLRKKKSRLNI